MQIKRRKTRVIKVGRIRIGGNNPILIQSMAKTKTSDVETTIKQAKELALCGCEILRLAIKDQDDAKAIKKIKPHINIPIVADIHFDWRLAVISIDSGADKIRLNPGNIYKKDEVENVVRALKFAKIPLRIGLNSGSVKYEKANMPMSDKLLRSALDYIKLIEKMCFYDIVVSLKAASVLDTIEAYRKISKVIDYPLHLGVTATGFSYNGAIKSSIALGALLIDGIGDTIRVSLTDEPRQEMRAAKIILSSLGLRSFGPQIISCPTCGRCEVNLISAVKELEDKLAFGSYSKAPVKVAVMGCVVNGPGEAREADIGVAFGKKEGILFKKGKIAKKVPFNRCVKVLLDELK